MKKRFLLALAIALSISLPTEAQIIISSETFHNVESEVNIRLIDSISQKPLHMATIYLQPKGDTTIMYFNLSDTSGTVVLDGVVRGRYKLTAEFLGYRSFVKEFYISQEKEDLGIIKMVEDAVLLEAATVSAVGNQIEIFKDTIVYNATMFRITDNAVLGELLKKMPGFEVSSSGTVKVNGQNISKITVNGKTFFFDDPTIAVKNLPAKIVDKIRITDYKSDDEKSTGITNIVSQNKEMDISLKKEYEKGWFGNARFAGGVPFVKKGNCNQPIIANRAVLYNGNMMLSGYNDNDQITIIGHAKNIEDIGVNDYILATGGEIGTTGKVRPSEGLTTSRQFGANLNSSRIKGFDLSSMVNYQKSIIDIDKILDRTTMQEGIPSVYTNTKYSSSYDEDFLNMSVEISNKDVKKCRLRIVPRLHYLKVTEEAHTDSHTSNDLSYGNKAYNLLNTTSASMHTESDYLLHRNDFTFSYYSLGKKGRSLTLSGTYFIKREDGQKIEFTAIEFGNQHGNEINNLYFKSKMKGGGYRTSVMYVEPVGENWKFATNLQSFLNNENITTDAYRNKDDSSSFTAGFSYMGQYAEYNDYYSSVSDYTFSRNTGQLLAQYSNNTTAIQFGGSGEVVSNVNYSKTYGLSHRFGKGEYIWNWSPFVRVAFYNRKDAYCSIDYSGSSNHLNNSQIIPAPDISNPAFVKFGNIYLEPEFSNNLKVSYSFNNKKNFSNIFSSILLSHVNNSIVNANWFDDEGIQYNMPVNSNKKGLTSQITIGMFSMPLNNGKSLKLDFNANMRLAKIYSYQKVLPINNIDLVNFNYTAFMSEYFGNSSGNLFYSGNSGFKESGTTTTSIAVASSLKYKNNFMETKLGGKIKYGTIEYSQNKNANTNTWDYQILAEVYLSPPNKYTLTNTFDYRWYDGYSSGYGKPCFLWNLELNKSIKAITFSLKIKDILNQTTASSRVTSANYIQDAYRSIIGRRFMIGITFNFGKMNAAKNNVAAKNILNMIM